MIRQNTYDILDSYQFRDNSGKVIEWTEGQLEIIDCIINRSSPEKKTQKRIQIEAATQYGKSIAVAAGVLIRVSSKPEEWAIVAGTKDKARIIMEYIIMFALNTPLIRTQLDVEESLERLRMRKSQDRLTFKRKGDVRVYSAESKRVAETSKALMGFGAPNVVEDESALIDNKLQATVMRMLGGAKNNFLVKIGNPFNRNHFLKTSRNPAYYKIFIDYKRALEEGRFTPEFIQEMREDTDPILFRIFYECLFPPEDMIEEGGWMPLITETEVEKAMVEGFEFMGAKRFGGDVAGGGRNFSAGVMRSTNVAKIVYKENQPDTMIVAGNFVNLCVSYRCNPQWVAVDKNGIGRGLFDRMRELPGFQQTIGFVGQEEPSDKARFDNRKTEAAWRTREWLLHGGKLEKNDDWYQLCDIKYKVIDSNGKIQLMPKTKMLREGIDSPDIADSLFMTFARKELPPSLEERGHLQTQTPNPDPYSHLTPSPSGQTYQQSMNTDPYD